MSGEHIEYSAHAPLRQWMSSPFDSGAVGWFPDPSGIKETGPAVTEDAHTTPRRIKNLDIQGTSK